MRQLQEMALRHESEQLGQLSNRNGLGVFSAVCGPRAEAAKRCQDSRARAANPLPRGPYRGYMASEATLSRAVSDEYSCQRRR
jgi:hypothetical protein